MDRSQSKSGNCRERKNFGFFRQSKCESSLSSPDLSNYTEMAQLQRCIIQYVVLYSVTALVRVRKLFVDTHTAWYSCVGTLCFWHPRNKHLLRCTLTSNVWPQRQDKRKTKFCENVASIYNKIPRFLKSGNNNKHSA
jgi:hypothetical protein